MNIKSRRRFLLFLSLLPTLGISNINSHILSQFSRKSENKDDFIIVNGWVLKKSDLI